MMEFDMTDVSVMIGIPCGPDLPWQTLQSIVETCLALRDKGIPFELKMVAGCSIVEQARSKVTYEFLQSSMNRLFMIDSDMQWKAQDFIRMLALSTKMDVVCAAYPAKRDACTFMLKWGEDELVSNEYGCVPIDGVGLGFTIVHRGVIAELSDNAPKLMFPGMDSPIAHIFRCDADNGAFRGEDMAFFADVKALGYKVNLDPNVSLGHVGTKTYTGSILDAMRREESHSTKDPYGSFLFSGA